MPEVVSSPRISTLKWYLRVVFAAAQVFFGPLRQPTAVGRALSGLAVVRWSVYYESSPECAL